MHSKGHAKMNKILQKLIAISAVLISTSMGASARQPFVDVSSNLGALEPVALGEDISLSPCGSDFTLFDATPIQSLCSTANPDALSINYLISFGSTTSALTFGSGGRGVADSINSIVGGSGGTVQSLGSATDGLGTVNFSTGVGTLFSTVGTYVISLITAVDDSQTLADPSGRTGRDSGLLITDSGLTINGASVGNFDGTIIGTLGNVSNRAPTDGNGRRNVAFSQATVVISEAVTVPEPSTYLMLLLAMLFVYRRQMNKRTIDIH